MVINIACISHVADLDVEIEVGDAMKVLGVQGFELLRAAERSVHRLGASYTHVCLNVLNDVCFGFRELLFVLMGLPYLRKATVQGSEIFAI